MVAAGAAAAVAAREGEVVAVGDVEVSEGRAAPAGPVVVAGSSGRDESLATAPGAAAGRDPGAAAGGRS